MPYKNNEDQVSWRKAHPYAAREANLIRNYGINAVENFKSAFRRQKGLCLICQRLPIGKHNQATLHYDHDHVTEKFRGLLCSNCNRGLGLFQDSPALLDRAAMYVRGLPMSTTDEDWTGGDAG